MAGLYRHGTSIERRWFMRTIAVAALVLTVASCRGEKVPRDYQNQPPAMTHPVTTSSGTPTAHGMPNAAPEPSKGAEGKNVQRQPTNPTAPTTTLGDQAPVTQTTTVTTTHT
jgi:hypothetical protein